jgi:hypothetical protein
MFLFVITSRLVPWNTQSLEQGHLGLSPWGAKQPETEADNSPAASAEIMCHTLPPRLPTSSWNFSCLACPYIRNTILLLFESAKIIIMTE